MSKKEERLDPRVVRTRNLLREALIELIPEKGYEAITIKDITDRATLNRATFYLHYRDKDDLLNRGFVQIWSDLTERNPLPVMADGRLSLEGTQQTILSDFQHLAKHAEFYRVMIGAHGVAQFIHRMQEHIYQTTEERLKEVAGSPPETPLPLDLVLQFISSAYVGLMHWWVENDMPNSPEQMASMITKLYNMTPFEAMGLHTE
jgi:AcrR family transcriptional regulator